MKPNKQIIQKIITYYEAAIAKIILYCLCELPFPLGIKKTISVLKGTKSTFNINFKLNELETFSLFPSYKSEELKTIIELLIEYDLIKVEYISAFENMPVIKLSEKGEKYLNNEIQVPLVILDNIVDKTIPVLNDAEKELYIKLKELRRSSANSFDITAFMVCHDNVLRELAVKKPLNREDLLKIKGVGEKFAEKYGNNFLNLINS